MERLRQVGQQVSRHNPSGDLPYHGTEHAAGVVRVLGRILEGEVGDCREEYSQSDIDNLYTAAWYHDYAHSGGRHPDTVNVARAIVAATEYLTRMDRDDDIRQVTGYIQGTLYPPLGTPQDLLEGCLRDADVLQAMVEGEVVMVMDGLRREMGVRQKRVLSLEEMVQRQKDFMSGLVLYTDTGRHLWQMHYSDYLEAIEAYVAAQKEKGNG